MLEKLLLIEDLADVLGLSPETIRSDVSRAPDRLPPRLIIPGRKAVRWRKADVDAWLAGNVEQVEKPIRLGRPRKY